MSKDSIEKLKYYASMLEGIKCNVQEVESQILQTIKEEEEMQRMKLPELEVINPEMAVWE